MKRYASYLACLAGLVILCLVLPRFTASQPRDLRITRADARRIADAQAKKIGMPIERAWAIETWVGSPLLDKELDSNPDRRTAAAADPAIGPRLGGWRVTYFRRGLEKWVPYGQVYVAGQKGEVLSARRRHRNEEAGAQLTEAQLRARADAFVASRQFPGAPSPVFESARPTVLTHRTDWTFRYRVDSKVKVGNVVPYLYVFFAGDKQAGWDLIEEYADGSQYRGDNAGTIVETFVQFGAIFTLLLVLLISFLKKYHAGEVGVRMASFLFAVTVVLSIMLDLLAGKAMSEGTGFGGIDAQQTAYAWTGFKFLFYDVPLAVLVFFAWAVGESYARERWGERLASFDAILRRDPLNATVGRSILNGLLTAPAVAAAAFLSALIPVVLHTAHPTLGGASEMILSSGPFALLLNCAVDAVVIPTIAILCILAYAHKRRALWLGVLIAVVVGTLAGVANAPIEPSLQRSIFGFGAILATVGVFLAYDLLASAVSLLFGGVIVGFVPLLAQSRGEFGKELLIVSTVPLLLTLAYAVAAMITKREVVYTYEDLAPHVKRIVERERVKAEIDAANRIQAALLPLDTPSLAGASVASHYRAATEIGGDYFDFLPQPTGEIGIAFGDVSGHGLTSGIVMAMAKSALLVQVDYDASPRAVMNVLNEIVIKTAPKRILMTFFFGLLDPRSQTLRFSSAGHLDPYVYRAAERRVEALSSWGFPLGVRRRDAFREHTVDFAAGDRLILYSDGLIEAVDDDGNPFGFDRFEATLVASGHGSAEEIKKALLQSVKKFTRNRPPEDDQTLVVVSFDEAVPGVLRPPVVATYGEHVN